MPRIIAGRRREREQSREPSVFVLYHGRSHVTGNRLGDYLGVPHGREDEPPAADYLIRWGSRAGTGYTPTETVINSRSSLNENTDKLQSLRELESAGIPVPDFTTDRDEISETFGYPAVGREEQHSRGEDINLILQWRDTYLTDNDYFVEYIPTEFEYRMHVLNGEVIHTHEKRLRSEEDNHPFIRNAETGWVFVEPRDEPPAENIAVDAVGALGLDFGAVDIVREEGTGDEYVLEVNSAPSLDEANLERYGDAFAEMVGLDDYPGLDAVEFDDEPEEEQEENENDGDLGELFG